jgi:hypothetical protein
MHYTYIYINIIFFLHPRCDLYHEKKAGDKIAYHYNASAQVHHHHHLYSSQHIANALAVLLK